MSESNEKPESTDVVVEMALCEVPHIFLHTNQLYRFVAMPGCEDCERIIKLSAKDKDRMAKYKGVDLPDRVPKP